MGNIFVIFWHFIAQRINQWIEEIIWRLIDKKKKHDPSHPVDIRDQGSLFRRVDPLVVGSHTTLDRKQQHLKVSFFLEPARKKHKWHKKVQWSYKMCTICDFISQTHSLNIRDILLYVSLDRIQCSIIVYLPSNIPSNIHLFIFHISTCTWIVLTCMWLYVWSALGLIFVCLSSVWCLLVCLFVCLFVGLLIHRKSYTSVKKVKIQKSKCRRSMDCTEYENNR